MEHEISALVLALTTGPIFLVLLTWTLVWKGLALWRAAHNESKIWFIALLLINTAGILEILYLFVFGKRKTETETETETEIEKVTVTETQESVETK